MALSNWRTFASLSIVWLFPACGPAEPAPKTTEPVEIFSCHSMLIGLTSDSCTGDVQGPGVLRIAFKPDPPQSSWEVGITGLAALAETCEFHGSFDQTRLAALQGRGATELVCPIQASIDRAYHGLSFSNQLVNPNSSISIAVIFER